MQKQIWWLSSIIILVVSSIAYGGTLQITNITDTQFTLSWSSEQAEFVQVRYGFNLNELDKTALDDSGERIESTTHHITVSELKPQTTYYYQIVSGSVTVQIGEVTTGQSLIPSGSNIVYGRVFAGNQPAQGAIVYLTLQDGDGQGSMGKSAKMSVLVDQQGYWCAELINFRAETLDSFFKYSDKLDDLLINVEGGKEQGQGFLKTIPYYAFPCEDIVLKK